MAAKQPKKTSDAEGSSRPNQGRRETVESIAVAVILALLFRGFVAEAFVIPTGSMAPTLMGAHKDLTCEECGYQYAAGASIENAAPRVRPETDDGLVDRNAVVATVCPNCRSENGIDLAEDPNARTFSGDRILVSKFSYAIGDPRRWDVIVFKYPYNAKQNYIKRLVGLPGETLVVRHGDIYVKPAGAEQFEIARKPPKKLLAMSHLVYDTAHPARELVAAGWPSRWQPWRPGATSPPDDSWQVEESAHGFSATLAAPSSREEPHWLRYFHRIPEQETWDVAMHGGNLAAVDPYASRAITDFYSYNAYVVVPKDLLFERPGRIRGDYRPELGSRQFDPRLVSVGGPRDPVMAAADGMHWVGDLILETDVEVEHSGGVILLDLVEAGVHYRCEIDTDDGTARLGILQGDESLAFLGASPEAADVARPRADTGIRGPGRYQLRLANVDDCIQLWVDGRLVEFDVSGAYDPQSFPDPPSPRPHYSDDDPLDAAPASLGVRGSAARVHRLQLHRDQYYIATRHRSQIIDYRSDQLRYDEFAGKHPRLAAADVLRDPRQWDGSSLWDARREVSFELEEDQFFPMGDNSPESMDARCWNAPQHHVDRDMLIGKALVIFWPHPWRAPIPFMPNFQRMGFIR